MDRDILYTCVNVIVVCSALVLGLGLPAVLIAVIAKYAGLN